MNDAILIRLAEPSDALAIIDFNQRMAQETEEKTLPTEIISAGVSAVFADAQCQKGFYVVAETDMKEVVGCLLVTFEWSDWRNGWFWWIQSVYIRQEFRGQGIYKRLYEWVKAEAKQRGGICGFRLYVEKENTVAQVVYRNLGMEETGYKMFEELI